MAWTTLTSLAQLQELKTENHVFVVFKHSTRCVVSSMAKRNMEFDFGLLPENATIYLLDLLAHRDVSNYIAAYWKIRHESPQILVLKGDTCLYHASHQDIDIGRLLPFIS